MNTLIQLFFHAIDRVTGCTFQVIQCIGGFIFQVSRSIHRTGLRLFDFTFRFHLGIPSEFTRCGLQFALRIFGRRFQFIFETHNVYRLNLDTITVVGWWTQSASIRI